MKKSEQITETKKPKRITKRRPAIDMDKEELDSLGLHRAQSPTIDKSEQQSFQALTSDVSQQARDKAPVSENAQKKILSNENLQR
jgi:hypothetical protein